MGVVGGVLENSMLSVLRGRYGAEVSAATSSWQPSGCQPHLVSAYLEVHG